MKIKDII